MTPKEASERLRELSVRVAPGFSKFIRTRVAQDIMTMVQDRWIRRGVTYDGRLLQYSTRPTFVVNSDYPLNKKAFSVLSKQEQKAYNKAKKTLSPDTFAGIRSKPPKQKKSAQAPGGYRQIRQVAGYQVDHVDFDITTAMWRSVKVLATPSKANIIEVIYGPSDIESIKKVSGHNRRFNTNILMPSQSEVNIVNDMIQTYIVDELKKAFGGR